MTARCSESWRGEGESDTPLRRRLALPSRHQCHREADDEVGEEEEACEGEVGVSSEASEHVEDDACSQRCSAHLGIFPVDEVHNYHHRH